MNPKTFHMISLGCAKNTVDSDSMAQLLVQDGYQSVCNPRQASILIVNTCGFIGAAREESYSELRKLAEAKRRVNCLSPPGASPSVMVRKWPGGFPVWTVFSAPGVGWILSGWYANCAKASP